MQRGAVAGDDEQHVVDAHSDADHRGDLRSEVGHLEEVRRQRHEAQTDAQADDRNEDREAHGQQRPEADEQDERRDQQTDALGAEGALFCALNREAGELHLHLGAIGFLAQGEKLLGVTRLVVGHGLIESHRPVRDRAPLRDLARAFGRERRHHRADVRLLRELVERGGDRRAYRGVVDRLALMRLEDDIDVVSGPTRETALQQVLRLLRVGARRLEREVVVAAERARGAGRTDEQHDPQQQHAAPAAVRPVGQAREQGRVGGVRHVHGS